LTVFKKIVPSTLVIAVLFVPSSCEKALDVRSPSTSPIDIFDEVWQTIDKRYSLFSVKGVDWNTIYNQYRSQVTAGMTDKSLFDLTASMLETLKDGHVTLISGFDTATYQNFYKPFPANFNYNTLRNNYLKNSYQTNGKIIYKVVDQIGYIYYPGFGIDITDQQLADIFGEMSQTKGLILDVRNNTGGKSNNVNQLAGRFISAKTLVKYELIKKGPGHDDFFEAVPYYVESSGQYYKNRVVVLTNRACYSACNDFVMYMSFLPNVTLMGDQTGGGGSLPHNYILANGWNLQFSATLTLSPAKTNIENGVAPDINILITPQDEISGKDPILEKAFQALQ
jgi:hypothetical protein